MWSRRGADVQVWRLSPAPASRAGSADLWGRRSPHGCCDRRRWEQPRPRPHATRPARSLPSSLFEDVPGVRRKVSGCSSVSRRLVCSSWSLFFLLLFSHPDGGANNRPVWEGRGRAGKRSNQTWEDEAPPQTKTRRVDLSRIESQPSNPVPTFRGSAGIRRITAASHRVGPTPGPTGVHVRTGWS